MSFSSAEWTIPELCVWIVTLSKSAVNGLSSSVRRSLKYSDMIHSGAYAARDEVIEAAQQGKIIVSCAGEPDFYRSNPQRLKLSRNVWNNAELVDAVHWQAPGSRCCVARQIGQPTKEFRDLLVDSAKAKELWPSPEAHSQSATAVLSGDGNIIPSGPAAPSGTRLADTNPSETPPDNTFVSAWLVLEQARRIKAKEPCGKNEVRVYLPGEFSHLTRDDADRFYEALDEKYRPKPGPKGPWKNKSSN